MHLAEREQELPDSDFVRILRTAIEDPRVLSLGPGEPDFDTPRHIRAAAKKAIDTGLTHYSPIEGRRELREAIAKKYKRDCGASIDPDSEVIVTTGSTEALFLGLTSVVDPGEEVLVPDPTFMIYEPIVELLNGYPVSVPLRQEEGFQLTAEGVKEALKDPKRTKAIVICTPSNPTGVVLERKRLEELADIVIEYDLLCVVDEAYEKFVYDTRFHSLLGLNGMRDHVLSVQSFSKTYAMPGFRVGYAVGPESVIAAMKKMHFLTSLTAPTPSQVAAAAALNGPQQPVKQMIASYAKRRKAIVSRLREMPVFDLVEPKGAFYAFPRLNSGKTTSQRFCERMLREARVLAVPGNEFGRYGQGFVRFSYATALPIISKALDRVEKWLGKAKF
jgi:aminotransferase